MCAVYCVRGTLLLNARGFRRCPTLETTLLSEDARSVWGANADRGCCLQPGKLPHSVPVTQLQLSTSIHTYIHTL